MSVVDLDAAAGAEHRVGAYAQSVTVWGLAPHYMKHSSDMLPPRSATPPVVPPRQLVPILDDDRGPATFFHGRTRELRSFAKRLGYARQSNRGTIFLIQGGPGAGKTALLFECAQRATGDGWRVAKIQDSALYDPRILAARLDVPYATQTTVHREAGWRAGLSSVAALFRYRAVRRSSEHAGLEIRELLKDAARPGGLLLLLDEVQNLQIRRGAPAAAAIAANLDLIHNGEIGAPVVLLAGGLGTSRAVFGTFGISRFMQDCVQHLGRLSPKAERAVIRDWLVKAGGGTGSPYHLEHWIDTLAAECHGWPQHIQAFAPRAAEWLYGAGGVLREEVPLEVLETGQTRRVAYYEGRAEGLSLADRRVLAILLGEEGSTLEESDLIAALFGHRTPDGAQAVLQHALHKGVLSERPNGSLSIPIPSMRTWLLQEYAVSAQTLPPMSRGEERPTPARQGVRARRGDNRDRSPEPGR